MSDGYTRSPDCCSKTSLLLSPQCLPHRDKRLLPRDSKISSAFRYCHRNTLHLRMAICPWKIIFPERKDGARRPFEGSHAKHKTLRTVSSLNTNSRGCTAHLSASGPQGLCRVQGTPQEKFRSHAIGLGPSSARWCDPCLHAGQHSAFSVMPGCTFSSGISRSGKEASRNVLHRAAYSVC